MKDAIDQIRQYSRHGTEFYHKPMAYTSSSESIEALASEIGEHLYMDIAKWHLYLREAHLHTPLAEQLYPLLQQGTPSQDQVKALLQGIPVKLGGGKREIPLADLVPDGALRQFMDRLEDFQRR